MRCLRLRKLEEWDGNAKLSRSQSVFAAGGGGIVHNLELENSPVSLHIGRWKWWAGTKVVAVMRYEISHGLRLRHWGHDTVQKGD